MENKKNSKTMKIEKFEQELKKKRDKIQKEKKEVVKKCIELFCSQNKYGNQIDKEKLMDLIEKDINEYFLSFSSSVLTIQEWEKKLNKKNKRVEPTEEGTKGRKVKKDENNFLNNLSSEDWKLTFGMGCENIASRNIYYYLIKKERKNRSFLKKIKYNYSSKKKKDDNFIKNYEEDMEKIKEIIEKIKK